jgi:hypothetical protein
MPESLGHELPSGFKLRNDPHTLPPGFTLRQPEEKQNFFERSADDLYQRFGVQGGEILRAHGESDQGYLSTVTQLVGKVGAGSLLDLLGEAVISGGRGLSTITPDAIENPLIQNATKAGIALLNTDLGQKGVDAALKGAEAWRQFKQENPVMARNIEAVVNVGLLVAPVKGKPQSTSKPGGGVAAALDRSARRSEVNKRRRFVEELVTPEQNKKAKLAQVGRTTERGIFKQKTVELSPTQKLSAREVNRVPGVSPRKTLQGNYNAIATEVNRKARNLENSLTGLSRPNYFKQELEFAIESNVMARLSQNPTLVGNAETAARRVIEHALRLAEQNPRTMRGLLVTRRQLDDWVLKHKPRAFESGSASNAMTAAVREVRGEINDFIARRSGSVRVRQSLDQQSRLLRAMDDIAEKATKEHKNIIVRAMQDVVKLIPLRNELVAVGSVLLGIGGLGAAGLLGPFIQKVAITAGLGFGIHGAVMSPSTRKGISSLIKLIDKSVRTTTDPSIVRKMRAHRAALVEIIKNANVEELPQDFAAEGN